MILITGGTAQGKTAFAKGICKKIADGRSIDTVSSLSGYDCIDDCHELIRRLTDNGQDAYAFFEKAADEYPDMVFVIAEIGCGILPLDRKEREYRELTGRIGCMLARRCDEVYRLICGISQRIK